VRGWKTEFDDGEPDPQVKPICADCGIACDLAMNPITQDRSVTLCYDCAQARADRRRENESWAYVSGENTCITGGSVCVRGPGIQAIEWPGHDWSQWGNYRRCNRCSATQVRVKEDSTLMKAGQG
jgi:hypothetical protein